MKTAFAFLLLAASAQAFLPAAAPKMPARAVKAAPTMKLDAKNAAYAIAASPILLSASSALATEGTGEPFGYDNIAQVVCQVRHRAVLARDPAARALRASPSRDGLLARARAAAARRRVVNRASVPLSPKQVVVAHVIAITWKQWENTQPDNDTDFFGEYDQRRA